MLNNEEDIEVCGTATEINSGMEVIKTSICDLAIVDISLKGSVSGIELTKMIRTNYPKVNVLILSMHDESLYAERAIRAGARGYIMKHEMTDVVVKAIKTIMSGKLYLSENMSSKLLNELLYNQNEKINDVIDKLSDRELEILRFIGEGNRTQEIAEKLCISSKTVDTYKLRIKEKLNLEDSTELTKFAIDWHHNNK